MTKKTITKAVLVRDFEAGKLCIEWDICWAKATAIYLDGGERFTIRFDTYLSVSYPNSSSPCPKGYGYLEDYTFWNMETAKKFQASILPYMRIYGEAYIWGVRNRWGVTLAKKFQTREQAEQGAFEHPSYWGKNPLYIFNEKTGEQYLIERK